MMGLATGACIYSENFYSEFSQSREKYVSSFNGRIITIASWFHSNVILLCDSSIVGITNSANDIDVEPVCHVHAVL